MKAFILSFDQSMRTFQTLTQGKKSLFFLGPGPCVRPRLEDGREGEGDWRVRGRGSSDSASKAGPRHTHGPFCPHLKICVHLALFLFVYFLWGRTEGRLMNKDIKFKKNPKPDSILLPTLRAYIIPQCFSSRPSLTPVSFLLSSPLSLIKNTWKPRNASFQSPVQLISSWRPPRPLFMLELVSKTEIVWLVRGG